MFKQIRTKENNHQNVMEERKMGKYTQDAQQLLRLIGGKENIAAVSHCVTRMRFVLNDPSKADVEAIEAMKEIKRNFTQAGQFQDLCTADPGYHHRWSDPGIAKL